MEITKGLKGYCFSNGYKNKQTVLVGMSPGNSHFRPTVIKELLAVTTNVFSDVRVFVADKPAIHTYKGLGYTEKRAKRKARLNSNNLQNHSKKAAEELGKEVTIVAWDEFVVHPEYKKQLAHITKLYKENLAFRADARSTTRSVVFSKRKEGVQIEDSVDEAVWYLLKELAFLLASPKLFKTEIVSYVYHHRWPIYENLVNGIYDSKKKKLGFVLISPSLQAGQEK